MNAQDAFHKTVHTSPGGCEALAARMGVTAGVLRNKANPNAGYHKPTLDDVERVMALTGDVTVLHALAKGCGYVCVKVADEASASDVALLEVVTQVMSANGDFGVAINDALADGRIEQHEVERVKDAAFAATRALHSVVARFQNIVEK